MKSANGNNATLSILTVHLSTSRATQAVAIAVNDARQDIRNTGIVISAGAADSKSFQALDSVLNTSPNTCDFLVALENVVSKLEVFVRIVDKASKVNPFSWYARNGLILIVTQGSSLC